MSKNKTKLEVEQAVKKCSEYTQELQDALEKYDEMPDTKEKLDLINKEARKCKR